MYYLTRDKKIIDGNLYISKEDKYVVKEFNGKNYLFKGERSTFRYENWKEIKKQSDNVYDLIEVGDLVMSCWQRGCGEKIIQIQEKDIEAGIKEDSFGFHEHICAIYKPNSNGDYIKIWEVK